MSDMHEILAAPAFGLGQTDVTFGQVLAAGLLALALIVVVLAAALWRSSRMRAHAALEAAQRARDAEVQMAGIMQAQAEMQGRMGAIAEVFGTRQAELTRSIGERLDALTGRLGQSMSEQTRSTHESLAKLQERLAVIDTAQGNIQSLAGQVVELQAILSNKQTRGAFGQSRMEAIVADGLPMGAYRFQATLSNSSKPDCLVLMPNGAPCLAIDAKFPLEAWNAIRASDGAEAQRAAAQAFRRDLEVHIRDIAGKYLIPGETQDTAFMFVPSESIFAEIHENFETIVQNAHRARIIIVSPSLLMLSIQVIQAILKDARMREQAHVIQGEVGRLMQDLGRLDERVRKLHGHFSLATRDVDEILTSTGKLVRRGQKIGEMEFAAELPHQAEPEPRGGAAKHVPAANSKTGQLRLRVVEEEDS